MIALFSSFIVAWHLLLFEMKARAKVGEVLNLDPSLGVPEPYIPWFYADPSQVGFQQL